jgi:hypothetical protein
METTRTSAASTGKGAMHHEWTYPAQQYFCPIKHARKIIGTHARYTQFLDYGDAADLQEKLDKCRDALNQEDESPSSIIAGDD